LYNLLYTDNYILEKPNMSTKGRNFCPVKNYQHCTGARV